MPDNKSIPQSQRFPEEKTVSIAEPEGSFIPEESQNPTVANVKEFLFTREATNPGDLIALGMTKSMFKKQDGFPSDKLLGHKILSSKADDIGFISRNFGLNVTQEQETTTQDAISPVQEHDYKTRMKEFNEQLQSVYNIPTDKIQVGMILPVPEGWNSGELQQIKISQPAWSGKYIQLRKDPETGDMQWTGYNKPTVMQGELEPIIISATNFAQGENKGRYLTIDGQRYFQPGLIEETDPVTGIKIAKPIPEIEEFWKSHPEVTTASKIMKQEEDSGNYRISMLMAKRPELYKEFNKVVAEAVPDDIASGEGNIKLMTQAIGNVYNLNKKVGDVQKSYSDFQINSAIDSFNNFRKYSDTYNSQQDKLAAQIEFLGKDVLRASGKSDMLDKVTQLRVQMMRDPKSISEQDKNTYYQLNREIINSLSSIQELSPYVQQFQKNAEDYKNSYAKAAPEISILSTPDGKKSLDLIQKQAEGWGLISRIEDYFPKVTAERKEKEAKDLSMSIMLKTSGTPGADAASVFVSLARGLNMGFQDLNHIRQRMAGWLGILSEEQMGYERAQMYGRYGDLNKILYTPKRPTEGVEGAAAAWNHIANFVDNTAEMTGRMAPYLLMGAATPVAEGMNIASKAFTMMPESTMFFTSGYNDYYREARDAGMNPDDAKIRGILGGFALSLTQTIIPKARLVQRDIVTKDIDELLRTSARPDANALSNFFSKFLNKEVFENTYKGGLAAFSNEVAQQIADAPFDQKIAQPITVGGMFEQTLMFGLQASVMHGMFKGQTDKEARNAVIYGAHEHPLQTLKAIDDAITLGNADGSYDLGKLNRVKSEVSEALKMQYPSSFNTDQRVATFDLIKAKQEIRSEMGKVSEDLRSSYEDRIKEIDGKIREVASNPEKASDYLNESMKPLYEKMKKEGYFDEKKEVAASKEELMPWESAPTEVKESAAKIEQVDKGKIDTEKTQLLEKIDEEIKTAPEAEKPYHEQRKQIVDKYGMDSEELIKKLKEDGELKVNCPPGSKRKITLRSMFSRSK